MSKPRSHFSTAFVAATFCVAATAGAQGRAEVSDSLLRRIHDLDSVMIARSRAVDSIRHSLVRSLPPVDVHRGALWVRTDSALAPRVRLAVDSVAALVERRGGTVLASRIASHVLVAIRDSVRSPFGMRPAVTLLADTTRRWTVGRVQTPANPSTQQLAAGLTVLVEQLAMQGTDSSLAAWVMVGRAPLSAPTASESAEHYIELATTESAAIRRCRAHDFASCADALGIDSLPGSRLERWYAPQDYRSLLETVAPGREDSAAVVAWMRCRDDRDEIACRAAATALPNDRIPLPLSALARYALVREVLDAGGPGAYDRLLTATGTTRARLAAASGEPLDSTVARWLARVERSRPDRMHVPTALIVASLGWTAAFLSLALIRRTSWA